VKQHLRLLIAFTVLAALGSTVQAKDRCRYEIDDPKVQETKSFLMGRGFNTGLLGHIGRNGDLYYLRGRYFSSYAATPSFDHTTPMELSFADGSQMQLPVLEGAVGKLDYHPMLANNREAKPIFAIDDEQFAKLMNGTITAVTINRIDKSEVGAKNYKLGKRAARKIASAARCVEERAPAPAS